MRNNLKVVKRQPSPCEVPKQEVEVLSPLSGRGKERLMDAAADNFGQIIGLAQGIIEIQKMRAGTDAYVEKLEADRKFLREQTIAYVQKMKADTDMMVSKGEAIRKIMNDYYQAFSGYGKLSADEFDRILNTITKSLDGK